MDHREPHIDEVCLQEALFHIDESYEARDICNCASPATLDRVRENGPPMCRDMPWHCPRAGGKNPHTVIRG